MNFSFNVTVNCLYVNCECKLLCTKDIFVRLLFVNKTNTVSTGFFNQPPKFDHFLWTYSWLCFIHHSLNSALCLIHTIPLDTLHWMPMLKGTLNSSPRLICTKNLYSDGDELSIVYCTPLNSCVKSNPKFNTSPNSTANLHLFFNWIN